MLSNHDPCSFVLLFLLASSSLSTAISSSERSPNTAAATTNNNASSSSSTSLLRGGGDNASANHDSDDGLLLSSSLGDDDDDDDDLLRGYDYYCRECRYNDTTTADTAKEPSRRPSSRRGPTQLGLRDHGGGSLLRRSSGSSPREENDDGEDDDDEEQSSLLLLPSDPSSLGHLLPHAWSSAESLTRKDDGQLVKMSDIKNSDKYQHPRPFFICDHDYRGRDDDDDREDIVSTLVGRGMDRSLLYIPPESDEDDDDCVVLTTTTAWARRARGGWNQDSSITVEPLLDVMKIYPGTLESVTSPAWRVPPFTIGDEVVLPSFQVQAKDAASSGGSGGGGRSEDSINFTNFIPVLSQDHLHHHQQQQQLWERMLTVDLVPGLEIHEEQTLLDLVENVMQDLQEMAEVGWLMRHNVTHVVGRDQEEDDDVKTKEWRQLYLVDHSLVGVPPLHEMFSLASSDSESDATTASVARRWDVVLSNGLESYHLCNSLFRTLYVATGGYPSYNTFDLILNPVDGPPPEDIESSASNEDCVLGLIAALSVHPYVLGVEANVPEYRGWSHAAGEARRGKK